MDKSLIFVTICVSTKNGQQVNPYFLQTLFPNLKPKIRPLLSKFEIYLKRFPARSTVQRMVDDLINEGLVRKKRQTSSETQHKIFLLEVTEFGWDVWNRIVEPLLNNQPVSPDEPLLEITERCQITEKTFLLHEVDTVKVVLDPVIDAWFPLIREVLYF